MKFALPEIPCNALSAVLISPFLGLSVLSVSMAILPTDRNDKKAHRIKYNNHSFEIYSMLFVESICKLTNKFESGNRYTICGRFIPEKKLALFNLDKAEKVVYDIRYGG